MSGNLTVSKKIILRQSSYETITYILSKITLFDLESIYSHLVEKEQLQSMSLECFRAKKLYRSEVRDHIVL